MQEKFQRNKKNWGLLCTTNFNCFKFTGIKIVNVEYNIAIPVWVVCYLQQWLKWVKFHSPFLDFYSPFDDLRALFVRPGGNFQINFSGAWKSEEPCKWDKKNFLSINFIPYHFNKSNSEKIHFCWEHIFRYSKSTFSSRHPSTTWYFACIAWSSSRN